MVHNHFWTNSFLTYLRRVFVHDLRVFLDLRGGKLAQYGLKMSSLHLFVHPKWSTITFGKPIFDPFFGPKTAHFQGSLGL